MQGEISAFAGSILYPVGQRFLVIRESPAFPVSGDLCGWVGKGVLSSKTREVREK